jgi:hypothetical protein
LRYLKTNQAPKAQTNHTRSPEIVAGAKHIDNLGKDFVKELEAFFVNYHQLKGKEYRILDVKAPGAAQKCVDNWKSPSRSYITQCNLARHKKQGRIGR